MLSKDEAGAAQGAAGPIPEHQQNDNRFANSYRFFIGILPAIAPGFFMPGGG
ncbi:hypothetical protein GCM10027051_34290 [Niabella terrae]